jgi:hypothetical protein
MVVISARAKAIEAFINQHPDANVGLWPLEISGEKRILPFYRIPLDLLCYNVNNGRLAMDVADWEKQNGRKLDATDPNDATIIKELLLRLDKDKTILLKDDIRKKSQMEPGVITNDGYVINGNRRMAILEELHHEEPTGKWSCLEVIWMPPTITEKDIWRIEAGLQLSKGKVAEYHPVNELLKIKQGRNANLTVEEIAAALYGRSVDEVRDALRRLELIDSFLDYFKQPGNYALIRQFGLHEYFIDLQKNVIVTGEKRGLKAKYRQQEIADSFQLIAAHIRIQGKQSTKKKEGITHWDIRKLGKIFSDVDAVDVFTKNIRDSKQKTDPKIVIEDFRSALDVLDYKEKKDQPVKLIEKAISALNSIDKNSKHFKEPTVISAMVRLTDLINRINEHLKPSD